MKVLKFERGDPALCKEHLKMIEESQGFVAIAKHEDGYTFHAYGLTPEQIVYALEGMKLKLFDGELVGQVE